MAKKTIPAPIFAAGNLRPLSPTLRAWCLGLLWMSMLPLLWRADLWASGLLVAVAGGAGVMGLFKPVSLTLRMTIVFVLGLIMAYGHSGSVQAVLTAMMMTVVLMKATEIRTVRDGYSVVGFSLIGPFVALLTDRGSWLAVLAALTLVGALSLSARLAEWREGLIDRGLKPHLWRVLLFGAMAVPLSAAGFWLIPRLDSPLWGLGGRDQGGTGISGTMAPGDWSKLFQDPSTALRVNFQGPRPNLRTMYWRGPVLWEFDGRMWRRPTWAETDKTPPAFVRPVDALTMRYRLSIEPTSKNFGFVLEMPGTLTKGMRWGSDVSPTTSEPVRSLTSFELETTAFTAFESTLTPEHRAAALQLPDGYNPKTLALVKSWRARGLNDEEIVQRALRLFEDSFMYSYSPPLLGRDTVDDFLFGTKEGYCEHYSSAFVVMMRAAGIPARVITGYQGGLYNEYGDYWRVRQADAHAWTEVWLPGKGWVRQDPTAVLRYSRPEAPGQEDSPWRSLGVNGGFADWIRSQWGDWVGDFDAERQRDLLYRLGLSNIPRSAVASAAVAISLFVLWAVTALVWRERREREAPPLRAWRQLVRRMRKAGYAPLPHEAPQTLAQRVAQYLPTEQAQALLRATEHFVAWRYSGQSAMVNLPKMLRAVRLTKRR